MGTCSCRPRSPASELAGAVLWGGFALAADLAHLPAHLPRQPQSGAASRSAAVSPTMISCVANPDRGGKGGRDDRWASHCDEFVEMENRMFCFFAKWHQPRASNNVPTEHTYQEYKPKRWHKTVCSGRSKRRPSRTRTYRCTADNGILHVVLKVGGPRARLLWRSRTKPMEEAQDECQALGSERTNEATEDRSRQAAEKVQCRSIKSHR